MQKLLGDLLSKTYNFSLFGSDDRASISFEERMTYILPIKKLIAEKKEAIRLNHLSGAGGVEITKLQTLLADSIINEVYNKSEEYYKKFHGGFYPSCSIIAVGGYGRGELNPHSDIDILFLYKNKVDRFIEYVAKNVISLLWDIGFEVGHSVRSVDSCVEIALVNNTAKTAMLESRYITGNKEVFHQFENIYAKKVLKVGIKNFISSKIEERKNQTKKFNTIYLAEPNIKEGIGGLRDFHSARWIAQVRFGLSTPEELCCRGIIDPQESKSALFAFDFLLRVRNGIHFLSGKKNDLLSHSDQVEIAKNLHYVKNIRFSSVEQFMYDFYKQCTILKRFSHQLIRRAENYGKKTSILKQFIYKKIDDNFSSYKNELCIRTFNPTIFEKDRFLLLRVFLYCQQYNLLLSEGIKKLISSSLHLIDHTFVRSKDASLLFLKILKNDHTGFALRTMHELSVLGRYIEEFKELTYRKQNDSYHRYTTDEHTLKALDVLDELLISEEIDTEELKNIYLDLSKPEILKLAIFLHDIGKGRGAGTDHAQKSAQLSVEIIKRLKLGKGISKEASMLVENHLVMSHIAQRRDLFDTKTIVEFAHLVRNIQNLTMIYLLTYADISAVGVNTWTAWKARLIRDLYDKTYNFLTRDETEQMPDDTLIAMIKADIVEDLSLEIDEEEINDYFFSMPDKYILAINKESIINHIRLCERLKYDKLAIKYTHFRKKGYSKLMICTDGQTGLFSKIVGTLTAKNLNIVRAKVYTRMDGIAIDTIHVESTSKKRIDMDTQLWQRVEMDLLGVIEGKKDVNDLMKNSLLRGTNQQKKGTRVIEPEVTIDNTMSDTYTIIETINEDRIGALYSITNIMYTMGLDIFLAKVSTEANKGINVFYVLDASGGKIISKKRQKEISSSIKATISYQ